MQQELLLKYKTENNIPTYHNIFELDTLKYLSELDALPVLIKEDYTKQYETELYNLGSRENWNLGNLLYEHFNDNIINISSDVVDSYTYENITVCAVQIEIPYFEKMNQYLTKHAERCLVNSKLIVLDIRIDEHSLLNNLINNTKNNDRYIIFGSLYFSINKIQYALCCKFKSPYNGISSKDIVPIFRNICEKAIKDRNQYNIESYLRKLLSHFSYHVDTSFFMERIKQIT